MNADKLAAAIVAESVAMEAQKKVATALAVFEAAEGDLGAARLLALGAEDDAHNAWREYRAELRGTTVFELTKHWTGRRG